MPIPDHTAPAVEPVRKSAVVHRPQAEVFALFTDRLDTWWPLATHSIAADTFENRVTAEAIVFERHAGGRVLERMSDGAEAPWGTILAWEPPARFVMSWYPGKEPSEATELEVRFTAEGKGTRVDLEHRGWEIFGTDGQQTRDSYNGGWPKVLGYYERKLNG